MNKKIYRHILSVLAALCFLCPNVRAEHAAKEHIKERIATLGSSFMDIDMPNPSMVPSTIPQIQVERIRFDKEKMVQLIKKYGLPQKKGESWVCEIGSTLNPDFELRFREENGVYGTIAYDETAPRTPADTSNKNLLQAEKTAKNFLDELGIPYEYPFYTIIPLEPPLGDANLIKIVARLTMEGIPFNTTTGWTKDSDANGNGDPTPGAFLIVTTEGKLTTAIIRNPVSVVNIKDDRTPIKNWDTVLHENTNAIMDFCCTGKDSGSSLTLL